MCLGAPRPHTKRPSTLMVGWTLPPPPPQSPLPPPPPSPLNHLTHQSFPAPPPPCTLPTSNSPAEPPSYDSLFGRIRDTHKASRCTSIPTQPLPPPPPPPQPGFRKVCKTGKILPGQIKILWTILVRNNASVEIFQNVLPWTFVHTVDNCPYHGQMFTVWTSLLGKKLCSDDFCT